MVKKFLGMCLLCTVRSSCDDYEQEREARETVRPIEVAERARSGGSHKPHPWCSRQHRMRNTPNTVAKQMQMVSMASVSECLHSREEKNRSCLTGLGDRFMFRCASIV